MLYAKEAGDNFRIIRGNLIKVNWHNILLIYFLKIFWSTVNVICGNNFYNF